MPTTTFFNLNQEKQQKIFTAAVQEFSTRRFPEASINQIVKTAGISRGSFYQYFTDKKDLYLYLLTKIANEKNELMKQLENENTDASFFELYQLFAKASLNWAKQNPKYNKIGLLMEVDDSQFIAEMKAQSNMLPRLQELLIRDQQRGLIKPEVDTDLLLEMIYGLTLHVIKSYYQTSSIELFFEKHHKMVKMIQAGVVTT